MKDTGRKIVARFLAGLAIGLCYVWLIVDARAASAASVSALGLCAKVIVPSLFPFFVCSNLFCALGLERPMERVLSRVVEPLFGVPGSGAAALFVGLTGGYPSGAQSVGALYGGGSVDHRSLFRNLGGNFLLDKRLSQNKRACRKDENLTNNDQYISQFTDREFSLSVAKTALPDIRAGNHLLLIVGFQKVYEEEYKKPQQPQ